MRLLGLDVGSKTIGVAVSDALGFTAQGLTTLHRKSLESDIMALAEYVNSYQVTGIVVGLPLNMNGTAGPSAQTAQELGEKLAKHLQLPVFYQDERLTTVAAQQVLIAGDVSRKKRKQVVDKLAAVLILQTYLDSCR